MDEKRGLELLGVECPLCEEGLMIIRTNGKTREKFLGCSDFPMCYFTINEGETLDDATERWDEDYYS